tara:strand:+ start:187 stop:648 length:462 start_codon:yes stop_codon:yes gene_type:complete
MKFEILDNDVSLTMNIFIIISIVLAFIYNSSQMIKLYYYKATRDFNRLYIFLQIISNCIWISYFIEINKMAFLIPIVLNTLCLLVIGYYKSLELYRRKIENNKNRLLYNYRKSNYTDYNNNETINNSNYYEVYKKKTINDNIINNDDDITYEV